MLQILNYSSPFRVKLEDPDDDDDVDNCSIVIGLLQKGRRKQKQSGAQNLTIGFAVYKVNQSTLMRRSRGFLNFKD